MLNYYYDHGTFEVWYGDTLIVELPEAEEGMTDAQCESLCNTLWREYLDANKSSNLIGGQ